MKKKKRVPGEVIFMKKDSGITVYDLGVPYWWEKILYLLIVVFIISLLLSFIHLLTTNSTTCSTKGRYIPTTYLFCELSEPIE